MKIGLIGYGKMGRSVEKIATARGHNITFKADQGSNLKELVLKQADVCIEFTNPSSAYDNVIACLKQQVPIVSGTTGWNDELLELKKRVGEFNGTFLHSSNFSVGVNLFFEINKKLAILMAAHTEYVVTINETHHTHKKDSPSGTAISLAEQILKENKTLKNWVNQEVDSKHEIAIVSHREGEIPGTHTVNYSSAIDDLTITHTAHNRDGFALGAVLAAEFIADKKGLFEMGDVLKLN